MRLPPTAQIVTSDARARAVVEPTRPAMVPFANECEGASMGSKFKSPATPAVKREAEEDWGRDKWREDADAFYLPHRHMER
jgi:hypothetical protein